MLESCNWEDVGRFVEYKSEHGEVVEIGRIVGRNDQWIFVLYDRHMYCDDWQDYPGVATKPENLYWFKA
jgi:hypothetical protein